jgi:hypothetical protein
MGCLGSDPPDPAKGYVAGIKADVDGLEARRMIEALAQTGGRGVVNIPGKGPQEFDFTGLGQADYARQYGDQMGAQMLELQRQYGPEYVAQRLRELEASDPAGAAMRRQLWDTIQTSASTTTERPGAEQLQAMILDRMDRAGKLDPALEHDVSQQVLGAQTARGNWLGNAAGAQEGKVLASVSEAQRTQAQKEAMAFLTAGLSPQDAAFREQQQDMSNLGSFLSGETPTAQFAQLGGAQNGVVPFTGGGPLPGTNPNAGWQGVNNQMGVYNANQAANNNTVNPWIQGVAGAFNGLNAWGGMGGRFGGGSASTQSPMNYNIGTSGSFSGE